MAQISDPTTRCTAVLARESFRKRSRPGQQAESVTAPAISPRPYTSTFESRKQKMRTLCDVCEAAPARLFCAADEAALCLKCDDKVHGCNKLASRHVRVELAEARTVPRCDICENAPAFFYCGIDGTSLCLQCDMEVHIGGKKTHERYLLMAQRVELPSQKALAAGDATMARASVKDAAGRQQGAGHHVYHRQEKTSDWNNSNAPAVAITVGDDDQKIYAEMQVGRMIDLNSKPQHLQSQSHLIKEDGEIDPMSSDDECVGVVPQLTAQEVLDAST